MARKLVAVALGLAVLMTACGGDDESVASSTSEASNTVSPATTIVTTTVPAATTDPTDPSTGCADVIGVTIEAGVTGFTVSATVSSADEGWDKYADAWQVRTMTGEVLGERILAHPHETEQPFTRSLSGVEIPSDITSVVVAARDSVVGFCGAEFTAEVPHP